MRPFGAIRAWYTRFFVTGASTFRDFVIFTLVWVTLVTLIEPIKAVAAGDPITVWTWLRGLLVPGFWGGMFLVFLWFYMRDKEHRARERAERAQYYENLAKALEPLPGEEEWQRERAKKGAPDGSGK